MNQKNNEDVDETIISEEVFDTDFDYAGWESETVEDDEDEDMAQMFDY